MFIQAQAGGSWPVASNGWSPGKDAPAIEMDMPASLRLMPLNIQTLWAIGGMLVKGASGFILVSSVYLTTGSSYAVKY